jgi:4-hydroxybenzoate polyprenyltransferase
MEIKELVTVVAAVCFIAGIFVSSIFPLIAFILLMLALLLMIVWFVLKKKNVEGNITLGR